MELSDGQFEQLVGMLADNRVQIINATNELKHELLTEIERTRRDLREELRAISGSATISHNLLAAQLTTIEEDLGQMQVMQRAQGSSILVAAEQVRQINQSMDGLTQLAKSTWDLVESQQRRTHGESSATDYVSGHESSQPQ